MVYALCVDRATIIDAHHITGWPGQTVVIRDGIITNVFADGVLFARFGEKDTDEWKYVCRAHRHARAYGYRSIGDRQSGGDAGRIGEDVTQRITTVRDMAGDGRTLAGLSRDALVGDIVSPEIYYSAVDGGSAFLMIRGRCHARRAAGRAEWLILRAGDRYNQSITGNGGGKGNGPPPGSSYMPSRCGACGKDRPRCPSRKVCFVWGHAWLNPARPFRTW